MLKLNYSPYKYFIKSVGIQIQLLLKLNQQKKLKVTKGRHSNTTLVKVKLHSGLKIHCLMTIQIQLLLKLNNKTLWFKLFRFSIQIQLLLKLNLSPLPPAVFTIVIQIQLLLKLNLKANDGEFSAVYSNTTLVKVKC